MCRLHVHNTTEGLSALRSGDWRPSESSGAELEIISDTVDCPAGSSHQKTTKGWTWSAAILRWAVLFIPCSIGSRAQSVQENTPHAITPPAAWTVDTTQDGSIFSCLHQIQTLTPVVTALIESHPIRQCFFSNLLLSSVLELPVLTGGAT